MDYRLQTTEFFAQERHLCNQGLIPKLNLKPHHVTKEDVEEVFGVCSSYMNINHVFLSETKEELLALYKKFTGPLL
jgi:archaellum biogenesis ATPase FlaH